MPRKKTRPLTSRNCLEALVVLSEPTEGLARLSKQRARTDRGPLHRLGWTVGALLLIVGASAIVYLARDRPIDSPDRPPSHTPTPSATGFLAEGRDIGLGFRVCRVTELEGLDLVGDGSRSTAWTATDVRPDGRCNRSPDRSYIVAVDVDGDGVADAPSEPLRYCFFCRPVAAPDIDGDGDGELLVLEQGGSVGSYSFYEIRRIAGNVRIRPIEVAAPGHRKARHPPGKPLRFWVGGDEGYSASATCTGYPDAPVLVATWSNHPIEGPGSETTEVHRTRFRLRAGVFHVVEAIDTHEPTDDYKLSGLQQSRNLCGVDLSQRL